MAFLVDEAYLPASLTVGPMSDQAFAPLCPTIRSFLRTVCRRRTAHHASGFPLTGARTNEISRQLGNWARHDERGISLDLSTGWLHGRSGESTTPSTRASCRRERPDCNRSTGVPEYPHSRDWPWPDWVRDHPTATAQETASAFVDIINRAQQRGAVVSNHLSDRARDISIPAGDQQTRLRVRHRLQQLGAQVIDEHDAAGGPHWQVDY